MNILAVDGSHCETPQLHRLIYKAFEGAREVGPANLEVLELKDKRLKYCVQCEECLSKRKLPNGTIREELKGCTIKDDMQEVYDKLLWADAIIFASPVHNGGITTKLRSMMDRLRWMIHRGPLRWKVGAAITLIEGEFTGQETAAKQIANMIRGLQMVQCSQNYGVVGTTAREVDPHTDEAAFSLGTRVASVTRVMKAGREALPSAERERFYEGYHRFPEYLPDHSQEPETTAFKVHILGISGAHRKGIRNTVYMLQAALESARGLGSVETDLINLREFHIDHCKRCFECLKREEPECVQNDDMGLVSNKILQADGIIFGSPVHELGISARLKAMIDRCCWMAKKGLLRWKVAGGLSVAYMSLAGQETALVEISDFIRTMELIHVGFMYGGVGISGPAVGGHTPWNEDGRTKLTPVQNDGLGMRTSRYIGRMVAEHTVVIKAGLNAVREVIPRTAM